MAQNPVEDNVVTRFLLGLAVFAAMAIGGQAVAMSFLSLGVPYAKWVGVGVGAIAVFIAFTALYRRYDASYSAE
ncbi:hypothetical protein [Halostella pelagica]|uniref:hypothetical protein n=1 Tax=Halostella pelagica TaxID=2583824 RepID=UPI001080D0B9|nr:hypothetical protein [Halostella pelagica]